MDVVLFEEPGLLLLNEEVDGVEDLIIEEQVTTVVVESEQGPVGPQGQAGPEEHFYTYTHSGLLVPTIGVVRQPLLYDGVVLEVGVMLAAAAIGTDFIADVNIAGVSIYSDQGLRPRLPQGVDEALGFAPDNGAFTRGQALTVDIDQVGDVAPGTTMTMTVHTLRQE